MRALALLMSLAVAAPLLVAAEPGPEGPYNGLDAWNPGMGYGAPIARAFAFVEGRGVLFHSLDPGLMPTDDQIARIYQFPNCPELRPVLADDTPERDSPMRRIIDIVLASCVQPTSELELFTGNALHRNPRQMFVNAPVVPEPYASWPDEQLFSGPPHRPRVSAWLEGQPVKFITYDASWLPPWLGTAFPGHNVEVLVLSGDAVFTPGVTRFSLFNGAPLDFKVPSVSPNIFSPIGPAGTHRQYSPVWAGKCLAPVDNPLCGSFRGPEYPQCRTFAECASVPDTMLVAAPFEFLNCPVVNTDVDGDDYLSELEEFRFPDLWVGGPVLVV